MKMYFTKREIEMQDAKAAGEDAFSANHYDDAKYEDDPVLKALYQKGWRVAEADYYRFHSNYE